MHRDQVLQILQDYKRDFAEQYGILSIGVFGSVGRDEAEDNSDVDIVIRIAKPDLFELVGIKNDLEERLHRRVDLITYREKMNRFLKKRIDSEAIYA